MSNLSDIKSAIIKKFPGRMFGGAYDFDSAHYMLDLPIKNAKERLNDFSNTAYILVEKKSPNDWQWFHPNEDMTKFQNAKPIEIE